MQKLWDFFFKVQDMFIKILFVAPFSQTFLNYHLPTFTMKRRNMMKKTKQNRLMMTVQFTVTTRKKFNSVGPTQEPKGKQDCPLSKAVKLAEGDTLEVDQLLRILGNWNRQLSFTCPYLHLSLFQAFPSCFFGQLTRSYEKEIGYLGNCIAELNMSCYIITTKIIISSNSLSSYFIVQQLSSNI